MKCTEKAKKNVSFAKMQINFSHQLFVLHFPCSHQNITLFNFYLITRYDSLKNKIRADRGSQAHSHHNPLPIVSILIPPLYHKNKHHIIKLRIHVWAQQRSFIYSNQHRLIIFTLFYIYCPLVGTVEQMKHNAALAHEFTKWMKSFNAS